MKLVGFKCRQGKDEVFKVLAKRSKSVTQMPHYWEEVDELYKPGQHLKIFIMKSNSPEYVSVATEFKKTLPSKTVIQIQRI